MNEKKTNVEVNILVDASKEKRDAVKHLILIPIRVPLQDVGQDFPHRVWKKDGMGTPEIKYGDSICLVQHVDSGLWLTYQTSESKRRKEMQPHKQANRKRRAVWEKMFYSSYKDIISITNITGSFLIFFQAILHSEGHMDDGLTLSRSQMEECKAASLIRSSTLLFTRFIRQK